MKVKITKCIHGTPTKIEFEWKSLGLEGGKEDLMNEVIGDAFDEYCEEEAVLDSDGDTDFSATWGKFLAQENIEQIIKDSLWFVSRINSITEKHNEKTLFSGRKKQRKSLTNTLFMV